MLREVPEPAADDVPRALVSVFEACIPVVPYAPATAFLGREKHKLSARERDPIRVALVADAVGGMHGVTHTLDEIRERGVPGFEVEVIGTDMNVDRRLAALAAGLSDAEDPPEGYAHDVFTDPVEGADLILAERFVGGLLRAGRVAEHRPGAFLELARAMRTDVEPESSMGF